MTSVETEATGVCEVSAEATERCLPVVRASVRQWLAGLGWPDDPAEDIVLAVHEAVTNTVEHAYPDRTDVGLVDVRGTVETALLEPGLRRVRVSVVDHGRWQPDRHDRTDVSRQRGRGLTMMQALMAEMTVTAGAATGTEVELLSKTVGRLPAPAPPSGR